MDHKVRNLLSDLEDEIANRDREIEELSRKLGTIEAAHLKMSDDLDDRDEEIARLQGEIDFLNKTLAETILIKGVAK